MSDLFPDDRPAPRRAVAPTVVPWTCDAGVPAGIRETAKGLGARACRLIRGQVVVLLGDGRVAYLNLRGEQTGRASDGTAAPIWDDVPWGFAPASERINAA